MVASPAEQIIVPNHAEQSHEEVLSTALPLFREEALTSHQPKWLGEIVLIRPVSFAFLSCLAVCITLILLGYLLWGEYTRKARVTGHLVPTQGLVKVYASQRGTVIKRMVQDGEIVHKDQHLFALYVDRQSVEGSTQTRVIQQYLAQAQSLESVLVARKMLQQEHEKTLKTRIVHIEQQIKQLNAELKLQAEQVRLAEAELTRYRQLLAGHYVPVMQVQQSKSLLLEQRGHQHALKSSQITLYKELAETRAALNEHPLKNRNEQAELEREISIIKQRLAEAAVDREIVIDAPQAGRITTLMVNIGQSVAANVPMLSIIPTGSLLEAELYATSKAIGFVKVGYAVLLKYETYPFQKFGTYDGIVTDISRSVLRAEELPVPTDPAETYYKIGVRLVRQEVMAYGKSMPLQPGMQVQAEILLDRRSILEWLLDPIYSVIGRHA